MKPFLVWICGILLLTSVCVLSQAQSQASSAESAGVKVYSSQGYFVKAKNSNDYACYYSFTYTVKGYDEDGKNVSTEEETVTDSTLDKNEARELFTAPTDPDKKITYWITITGISGVRKIEQ